MSTITSGFGGPSSAALSQMRQQMFSKLDSNASGGIDEAEFTQNLSGSGASNEAKLKEAFSAFDSDGDGSLTESELSSGFQKLGGAVRAALLGEQEAGPRGPGGPGGGARGNPPSGADVLARIDTDQSGGVDEAEFIAGAPQGGPGASAGPDAAALKEMFASFDTDADGSLTADELQAGFESHRPQGPHAGPPPGGPMGGPPPSSASDSDDETENPFLSLLANSGESSINKSDLASLLASFAKLTQSGQVQSLSATA